MNNDEKTFDFDTIAVWRAAHQQRSDDLRVWLGEIPATQPKEQPQPVLRGGRRGALVTILRA